MLYSWIILLMTIQCLYFANAVRQRCNSPRFSCRFNNPCDPLCEEGQTYYLGRSDRTYVQCAEGECTEQRCPRRSTWNQESGRCENNGVEARCAFPTFDCADRNPCESTLCKQDVNNYPGPSPRRYVSCEGGCSEEQCPRRQVWDQDAQRCGRKPPSTPAPPAPVACTKADLTVYEDKLCTGTTIVTDRLTSPSLEQCKEACLAEPTAYGGAWNSDFNRCFFYYEQVDLDDQFTYTGMTQFLKAPDCSPVDDSLLTPNCTEADLIKTRGWSAGGEDQSHITSEEQCRSECLSEAACYGFFWFQYYTGICTLHYDRSNFDIIHPASSTNQYTKPEYCF